MRFDSNVGPVSWNMHAPPLLLSFFFFSSHESLALFAFFCHRVPLMIRSRFLGLRHCSYLEEETMKAASSLTWSLCQWRSCVNECFGEGTMRLNRCPCLYASKVLCCAFVLEVSWCLKWKLALGPMLAWHLKKKGLQLLCEHKWKELFENVLKVYIIIWNVYTIQRNCCFGQICYMHCLAKINFYTNILLDHLEL